MGCLLSVAPSLPVLMYTYRRLGRCGGGGGGGGGDRPVVGCSFLVDKQVWSSGLRLEGSWAQAALAFEGESTLGLRRYGLSYNQKNDSKVGAKGSVFQETAEMRLREGKVR